MTTTIALSVCNRPEYTQRCIASILAMKGLGNTHIVASIDRQADGSLNQDVLQVLKKFGINYGFSVDKAGCNGNVRHAIEYALATAPDFIIMVEDDIILADDAFLYFQWAAKTYKDDLSVRTIGTYNEWHESMGYIPDPFSAKRQNYFTCWGWGSWPDRIEEMLSNWTTGDDSHDTSWDVVVSSHLNGRQEIVPLISRSYNCGDFNGTHRGRAWPGLVSSGIVDCDGAVNFVEETV
jgi:hypothetical protein